jgi:hypothetical protein
MDHDVLTSKTGISIERNSRTHILTPGGGGAVGGGEGGGVRDANPHPRKGEVSVLQPLAADKVTLF